AGSPERFASGRTAREVIRTATPVGDAAEGEERGYFNTATEAAKTQTKAPIAQMWRRLRASGTAEGAGVGTGSARCSNSAPYPRLASRMITGSAVPSCS